MAVFITGGQAAERVNYVGWIESSGSQYIDAEVELNPANISGLRVIADIEILHKSGSWDVTGSGTTIPIVYFGVGGGNVVAYGNGSSDNQTSVAYVQGRYVWDYDLVNKKLSVGSLLSSVSISLAASGSGSKHFYISAYNNGSGAVIHSQKIYSYRFYMNGVLVRDLWPCYDPEGVACLYDKVEKKYHYNAGTGEFAAGGDAESGGSGETGGTITFTVAGTSCTADAGMTWAQWIASSYNTIGVSLFGSNVLYNGGNVKLNGTAQTSTDVIAANASYTT